MGGGAVRRLEVGKIAAIGSRERQQRNGTDAYEAKCRACRFARQDRTGRFEQPVGQHRGARQAQRMVKSVVVSFSTTPPVDSSFSFSRRASFSARRQRWRSRPAARVRSVSKVVSALIDLLSRAGSTSAHVLATGASSAAASLAPITAKPRGLSRPAAIFASNRLAASPNRDGDTYCSLHLAGEARQHGRGGSAMQ